MKILRFLKFIPVLVYSYVWCYCQTQISYYSSSYPEWFTPALLVSFLLSVVVIIWHLVNCILGKHEGIETAIYALLLKVIPIDACLEMLALMGVGLIIPIFGWMVTAIVYCYLFSIMVMTGTIQVGSIICLFREKKLPIWAAVLLGIASYVVILDLIAAVLLLVISIKNRTQKSQVF